MTLFAVSWDPADQAPRPWVLRDGVLVQLTDEEMFGDDERQDQP